MPQQLPCRPRGALAKQTLLQPAEDLVPQQVDGTQSPQPLGDPCWSSLLLKDCTHPGVQARAGEGPGELQPPGRARGAEPGEGPHPMGSGEDHKEEAAAEKQHCDCKPYLPAPSATWRGRR